MWQRAAPEQIFNREVLWQATILCCSFTPNKQKRKEKMLSHSSGYLPPYGAHGPGLPAEMAPGAQEVSCFVSGGSLNSFFIALYCSSERCAGKRWHEECMKSIKNQMKSSTICRESQWCGMISWNLAKVYWWIKVAVQTNFSDAVNSPIFF